jgi:hypothetical protein
VLGDDLIFRTKRGSQFRQESLWRAWDPVRIAEQLRHGDGGRLVLELYGHPDRNKAIERIRRAYTGATVTPIKGTDEATSMRPQGKIGGRR